MNYRCNNVSTSLLVSNMPLFLCEVTVAVVVAVVLVCSAMNADGIPSNIVNTRESDYKYFVLVLEADAQRTPATNFEKKTYAIWEHNGNYPCLSVPMIPFPLPDRRVYFTHLILLQICYCMLLFTKLWRAAAPEHRNVKQNKNAPKERKLNTAILVKIGNVGTGELSYNGNRLRHYIHTYIVLACVDTSEAE